MPRHDIVRTLRAIQRTDLGDRDWAQHVAAELGHDRRASIGANAYFYGLNADGSTWIDFAQQEFDADPDIYNPHLTPERFAYVYATEPRTDSGAWLFRDEHGRLPGEVESNMSAVGMKDWVGMTAPTEERGVMIIVPTREEASLGPVEAKHFDVLARLLAHQLRLRNTLLEAGAVEDARFDPAGRCQHASGAATDPTMRALLRRAVLAREAARDLQSSDIGDSLALWSSIVDGSWTFIDEWDEAGRRTIVAMRVAPAERGLRRLTVTELAVVEHAVRGEPDKVAAFALDVATSTVSNHLRRAIAKLGLRDRNQLIRVYQAIVEER
jgi:DNA-binding CsgD family transcriptional regulator